MTNKDLEIILSKAYKKLKSHLYTDKTLLKEKIALSRFENNIDKNIPKLSSAILSIDNLELDNYIKNIKYTLVPKKLDTSIPNGIYSNQTKENEYKIKSFNIFIDAPIEIHLISMLWTMSVGEKLDNFLCENIKGNRLHRDKYNKFSNESYKLFNPYYEGYSSFRDDAIDMATHLHSKNLDVTVLNIDIKEFYYNINFNFVDDLDNIEDTYELNQFMQKIHNKFHTEVKELVPNEEIESEQYKNFLPIGLVSSAVIANYILKDFDNDIIFNLKPEYYGRYVDDMLFVFSNKNMKGDKQDVVYTLLNEKTLKIKFKLDEIKLDDCNIEKNITFKINKQNFILQDNKVKLFYFNKNDSISLLIKFKDRIQENSSFFNFLPDDEKLFHTLESSSYNIFYNDSENKMSSLLGTSKDSLQISRNLTGVLSTIASANFNQEDTERYNKQLKNVFSGNNIFELRTHWEKVFTYLYICKNDNLFLEIFIHFISTISSISHDENKEQLSIDTKNYLLYCILLSVVHNPSHWENILSKIIKEVMPLDIDYRLIDDNINLVRESNMFSNHLITYPLLNFCNVKDKSDVLNLTNMLPVDFLRQKSEISIYNFSINSKKIQYTPRFIHYHEISLFYHYLFINNQIKKDSEYKMYLTEIDKFIFEKYNNYNSFSDTENKQFPRYDNQYNDNTFFIRTDDKEEQKKTKLKVGIVSIKINPKNSIDSYVDKPNLNYERLKDIINILNKSIEVKQHKVDLLIFPEISIPYAWVNILARFAKKNNIGIVFGVEHIKIGHTVSNYTCVMLPFKVNNHTNLFINFDLKKHYAPSEKLDINSRGFTEKTSDNEQPILYSWRNSVFSTFNCYELTDISYRSKLVGKVDFIVAIEYNKDTNNFSNIIDSLSRDIHSYIIQVNTSDYGDSRIVQPSKSEIKDKVKLKGGENIYLVIDDIDIKKLRNFQIKGHSLQKDDNDFKLTPPSFKMTSIRK